MSTQNTVHPTLTGWTKQKHETETNLYYAYTHTKKGIITYALHQTDERQKKIFELQLQQLISTMTFNWQMAHYDKARYIDHRSEVCLDNKYTTQTNVRPNRTEPWLEMWRTFDYEWCASVICSGFELDKQFEDPFSKSTCFCQASCFFSFRITFEFAKQISANKTLSGSQSLRFVQTTTTKYITQSVNETN